MTNLMPAYFAFMLKQQQGVAIIFRQLYFLSGTSQEQNATGSFIFPTY